MKFLLPNTLTTIPPKAIPAVNVKDQIIECISFAFTNANSPFKSFGKRSHLRSKK